MRLADSESNGYADTGEQRQTGLVAIHLPVLCLIPNCSNMTYEISSGFLVYVARQLTVMASLNAVLMKIREPV